MTDAAMSDASSAAASTSAPVSELDRLRARVATAPQDFDAWVALVAEAERQTPRDVALIRTCTEGLLAQFPLCFGYWQRLAKLELSLGTATSPSVPAAMPLVDAQRAAFARVEQGLQAIPHSNELWTFLVSQMMLALESGAVTPEEIRRSDNTQQHNQHSNRDRITLAPLVMLTPVVPCRANQHRTRRARIALLLPPPRLFVDSCESSSRQRIGVVF